MRHKLPNYSTAIELLVVLSISIGGCASKTQWVSVRETPNNRLASSLKLLSRNGIEPSARTQQLLRRFDLQKIWSDAPADVITQLDMLTEREDSPELEYAVAELAYIEGKRIESRDRELALSHYGTSLIHSYHFLFDAEHGAMRNPYDPQFRGACDIYNQSLEETLRIVQKHDAIKTGSQATIKTASQTCGFDVELFSTGWHAADLDHFEFVSDYEIKGLTNHYHTYGLGVPLIGVRKPHQGEHPAERFYPPGLAFPVTAFLRVDESAASEHARKGQPRFVLELHDSLDRDSIEVAGMQVPLESDLSTPLAYFLNQPQFDQDDISTVGLLMPGRVEQLQGLYMLEPYDPHKMPVVMVHGLWSSPATWMEMFNDLRSDPAIRDNYQFWFYLYPTGQPFWISAAQMRHSMVAAREQIDPDHRHPALDQSVLVGHSMGGLVSRLQSVDAENHFWSTISDHSLDEIRADDELKQRLGDVFFFQPNPSVRRVVTIGTPHRGSEFANNTTRWIGARLIDIPTRFRDGRAQLIANNRDLLRPDAPLDIRTSIDSLAPDSVLLHRLVTADAAPWVGYHNIVGRQPEEGFAAYFTGAGDGVVSLASAKLDDLPQLQSQIIVPADHLSVHRHPQAVLEVRRILLEQVEELLRGDISFPANLKVASGTSDPTTRR